MIQLSNTGVYLINGSHIVPNDAHADARLKSLGVTATAEQARQGTISHGILAAHNSGDEKNLRLRFDSLTSHDITYVGIIQTARASGMEKFPMPYVLTNCHNSLCAVGGTINQDDHAFALSAAKKYGGIYVPPHLAVIHSYNREMMAGCGKMILGSDSHTRYGALGTIAVGEGGGELAKQLVGRTYDIANPQVIAVYLTGSPAPGVGPHDVALSIIEAVYKSGYVKNKMMEFIGDGISSLSVDFRNGIDVMTTETTCWSSIWQTDDKVKEYLANRGRSADYRELRPAAAAYYDGLISVDLSKIEPCIALPFHPSNVYTIKEFLHNAGDILENTETEGRKTLGIPGINLHLREKCHDGGVWAEQAEIAGCSGGSFENIMTAAAILQNGSAGNGNFSLSVYPESQPVALELVRSGAIEKLMQAGAIVREAFCGPCFGAGDTPANGELSIRHVTRNFANREGSKPGEGQIASVALMDARSIAATARNNGRITSAAEIDAPAEEYKFHFYKSVYDKKVYNGTGKAQSDTELVFGPNIKDWPAMPALPENLLVKIISFITDPVTTTDELIPSGETSSYRSNPLRLAEFTLSRRDPLYVQKAKEVKQISGNSEQITMEKGKLTISGGPPLHPELTSIIEKINSIPPLPNAALPRPHSPLPIFGTGSAIYARKPGDGSAREQAASCQRVLGASANFALEYATKRYRSNLINWGILPFVIEDEKILSNGAWVFIPNIRKAIQDANEIIQAYILTGDTTVKIDLALGELTGPERKILLDGCLINYYAKPAG
ncbi:MAG: hydratase [Treponema sp.]|nr:hydratase [Treponema sp.]